MSSRDVAARLFITDATVRAHLNDIFKKLGLHHRVELALLTGELYLCETAEGFHRVGDRFLQQTGYYFRHLLAKQCVGPVRQMVGCLPSAMESLVATDESKAAVRRYFSRC